MIKVELFEVSMNLKDRETFIIKSEMLDMNDLVPSTGKKYVMMTFEEYKELTGETPKILLKPKKKGKK